LPRDIDQFFSKAYRIAYQQKTKRLIKYLWSIANRIERGLISEAQALQDMRATLTVFGLSPMRIDTAYMQANAIKTIYAPHNQEKVYAWDGVNKPFDFDKSLGLEKMEIYANSHSKKNKKQGLKNINSLLGKQSFNSDMKTALFGKNLLTLKTASPKQTSVEYTYLNLPTKKKSDPKLKINKILWGTK